MDLIDYIYDECHRQHVTNYGDFANGWQLARDFIKADNAYNFALLVQGIAREVEPDVNRYSWHGPCFDNLRTSHVGFMHGGSAAPPGEVREWFDRWCELAYDVIILTGNTHELYDRDVDEFIKSLLDIHPWSDGNGRTASILRNWMLNTLNDPIPLPFYYGDT